MSRSSLPLRASAFTPDTLAIPGFQLAHPHERARLKTVAPWPDSNSGPVPMRYLFRAYPLLVSEARHPVCTDTPHGVKLLMGARNRTLLRTSINLVPHTF